MDYVSVFTVIGVLGAFVFFLHTRTVRGIRKLTSEIKGVEAKLSSEIRGIKKDI